MYQLICQNQCPGIAYSRKDTRIGMVSAVEYQCRFRTESRSELLLQLFAGCEVSRQQT